MAELFVKLDCSYLDNEKMLQVSETAELLYLRMLTLSKRLMSDGRIVTGHLQRYGPMGPSGDPSGTLDAAHELVQVGLWEKEGEGAWLIAGWMERNAASDEIETRSHEGRENALKRWHRLGKHKNEPRDGCPQCPPSSPPSGDPEGDLVQPPLQETEVETEVEKEGKTTARKRATQLPDDWEPKDGHTRLARELGVNLQAERSQFADFHTAKGSTFKDWDAAFRTWLRNAVKFGGAKQAPSTADGLVM